VSGPILELSYADLARRLQPDARRLPLEGSLETTFRCNLNCVHCYVNQPVDSAAARARELPTARLLTLIDEIAGAGCLGLLLTGGEVLVRADFRDLYPHAIRRGLLVTVFSNGTLVDDRVADLFDEYRPERVEISLYGMSRETSERITRVPGSHAATLRGIRRLRDRGIPFRLKTMAMSWNRHEIAAMAEYAGELGVGFSCDGLLNPRIDCGADRTGALRLAPEEIVAVELKDPGRAGELRAFCQRFVRPEAVEPSPDLYTCGAAQTSFALDPYGYLHPCLLSRRAGVDLCEDSFAQGWSGPLARFRRQLRRRPSPCRACSLISLCGSCPAAAELVHGDPEGLVVEFCRVTHLRAHVVMGDAGGHRADAACCLEAVSASGATFPPIGPGCPEGGSSPRAPIPRAR
jgi:radical SAM protein with 4Fe4S-binding SPASM domain